MATEHVLRTGAGITTDEATVAITYQRTTVICDEVSQWVKEGRVFEAGAGVLTTPEAQGVETITRQEPQLMIRVPASIVVVPLMVIWTPEATTAVLEMLVSCCNNDPGVSNRTATTPVNVNTRYAVNNSAVNVYITDTDASGTAPTGVADLYREYHQADRDAITGAPTPPLIYNPRTGHGQECVIGNNSTTQAFLVHAVDGAVTTNTGFIIATWAEFTYDEYYG